VNIILRYICDMGGWFSCGRCRRKTPKTQQDTPGSIQNMPPMPSVPIRNIMPPVSSVPIQNMPLKAEPWYFGKISRIEAEKHLLLPVNSHGSIIIRDSETSVNAYSLSGKLIEHIF